MLTTRNVASRFDVSLLNEDIFLYSLTAESIAINISSKVGIAFNRRHAKLIDKEKVRLALSTVTNSGTDNIRLSDFEKLDLQIAMSQLKLGPNGIVNHLLRYISQDLSNILIIINKLDWERDLWVKGALPNETWLYFASTDIDIFHVELRSIFDYIAEIIQAQSSHPTNVPKSFEKLRVRLEREIKENRNDLWKNIGEGFCKLVLSCNWFEDIKDVRDANIHTGARTLIFLDKPKILFQMYQGWNKKVNKEELMENDSVVNFEFYAGLYICYLLTFLDEFANLLFLRYSIPKVELKGGHQNTGFGVLEKWAEKVL